MLKTKNGVRSLAFIIAMVMILCLVPTMALAASTVSITSCAFDPITEVVTVAGTISTAGTDVTILALGAGSATDGLATIIEGKDDTQTAALIAYIDQKETDATTGAFTFSFKRRSGVAGGYLNINVGGEDVAAPVSQNILAVPSAPTLSGSGYYGDPIELTFTDSEAWRTAITSIMVNNTEAKDSSTIEAGKITLPAITETTVTTATVTIVAPGFADSTTPVALSNKTAGTIAAQNATVVLTDAAILFNLTDSMSWVSKITGSVVKINDVATSDYSITGLVMSIPSSNFALTNTEASKAFTVKVEVPFYTVPAVATVTANAPTSSVVLPASVSATYPAADLAHGVATITVPTITEEYGTTITWTLDQGTGFAAVTEGQAVEIARPVTGFNAILKANITLGDFIPVEKTYNIAINADGVAGIDVKITLDSTKISTAALALATVTVDGVATTRVGNEFTATTVNAGTHTAVIARPGFVTKTISFTTTATEVVVADASKIANVVMVAGDMTNDGKVNIQDFGAFGQKWNVNKANPPAGKVWDDKADFNGDEKVNIQDFGIFGQNWNFDITKQ